MTIDKCKYIIGTLIFWNVSFVLWFILWFKWTKENINIKLKESKIKATAAKTNIIYKLYRLLCFVQTTNIIFWLIFPFFCLFMCLIYKLNMELEIYYILLAYSICVTTLTAITITKTTGSINFVSSNVAGENFCRNIPIYVNEEMKFAIQFSFFVDLKCVCT